MTEVTDPCCRAAATAIIMDRTGAGICDRRTDGKYSAAVTGHHPRYREGDQFWIETDAPLGFRCAGGRCKLREGAQVTAAGAT